MMPIMEGLARWAEAGLGTVVHIGAGSGALLDDYAALSPRRVVLVEGDRETLGELEERAAGLSWAEVRGAVVAPQAGPVTWHRFNLATLNGPQESLGLLAFYPRLRQLGQAVVEAQALAGLLSATVPEEGAGTGHVLVLDVPGQELALLASLPAEILRRFDGIVLRGCSVATPGLQAAASRAVELLADRCYRLIQSWTDGEPLWPVHVMAFDAAAASRERAAERLQSLGHSLAQAEALAAERAAQVDALRAERDEARESLAQSHAAMATLRERGAAARSAADASAREAAELAARLQEALRTRDHLAADLEAARLAVAEADAMGRAVAGELESTRHAAAAELAAERRAAADELSAARLTAAGELADVRQAAANELAALRQATADELAGLRQSGAADLAAAAARTADVEAQLQAARQALEAEQRSVEALRQELATRTDERDEQGRLATGRRAQMDAAFQERDAQTRLAEERRVRIEALEKERDGLVAQVADQARRLEEAAAAKAQWAGEREALNKRAGEQAAKLNQELAEARQTASLTVKLQMLREADLRDLQQRYQAAQAQQQSQHELLSKLAQRLSLANRYFQQLSHEQQQAAELVEGRNADAP